MILTIRAATVRAVTRRAVARHVLIVLAGAALLVGSACFRNRPKPDEDIGAIMLRVENRSQEDFIIYAVRGGLRDRLGRSSAGGTFSVPLDEHVDGVGQVQLVGEPIGGKYGASSIARTQQLVLKPGMTVVWTIPTDHTRSFVEVR